MRKCTHSGGLHFRKAPGFFISGAKIYMRGNINFIRDSHKRNYTCISNVILRDERMSAKARGILVQILSYPDDWYLYKSELQNGTDKRASISSGLKELVDLGYLQITRNRDMSLSYSIVENPKANAQNQHRYADINDDFQHSPCSKTTVTGAENQHLLNTDLNTNILTTTKSVVSQNSNNSIKKRIEEKYNLTFSEDFYDKYLGICGERGLDENDYFDWLYNSKKNVAKQLDAYLYKAACNPNVINEYIRSKNQKPKVSILQPTVICPSCGHKFNSIDFTMRTCICGYSLDEIQKMKGGQNG